MDLDIFSAFSSRCPLVRTDRGHLLGSLRHMAVWLYRAKLRWLLMRSLPDVCMRGQACQSCTDASSAHALHAQGTRWDHPAMLLGA